MKFRVDYHKRPELACERSIVVESVNWYDALKTSLEKLEIASCFHNFSFSVLDDGHSADVLDPLTGCAYKIKSIQDRPKQPELIPRTPPVVPKTLQVPVKDQKEVARQRISPVPVKLSDTFSKSGKYSPGQTDAYLTHAFMNLSDLLERFGADQDGATSHVLDFATQMFDVMGGGILLHDINDPRANLVFRTVRGPKSDELEGRAVQIGQGPIGVCARFGVSLNIKNLSQETQVSMGVFGEVNVGVGPVMCVPVHGQEWLQGVIVLYRAKGSTPFSESEMGIVEHFSTTYSTYLKYSQKTSDDDAAKTVVDGLPRR